ncbi:MAG: LacI family DNA-binding transcriptional regulator [Shinella sp.]|nr:LacI family DNA-binding transcriptional regulator [Shinella sp.]
MRKSTLKDVAREAGVGAATVERVINARGGVAPETIEKVIRAAKKLDYGHRLPEIHRGAIRIEVLLVRPDTEFFARVNLAFERIAASLDKSVLIHRTFVSETDPIAVSEYISKPNFRRSGLVICAQDHPKVTESLRSVRASGVEVVQIVTKCDDPQVTYVGTNNYAEGRSAAYYMSGMLESRIGTFVAICHSGAYMNHRERIRGFSDYIHEKGSPNHTFSHVMLGRDEDLRSAELFGEALRHDSNIIGIYTAGGANDAIAIVLQSMKDRNIFWIGHELTEKTKRYLKSGLMSVVFDQAPEIQARRAIDTILRKLDIINTEVSSDPVQFLTINAQNV